MSDSTPQVASVAFKTIYLATAMLEQASLKQECALSHCTDLQAIMPICMILWHISSCTTYS